MRSMLLLLALAALALAAPAPQAIDLGDVIAAGKPVLVTPALNVPVQIASVVPASKVDSSAAAAIQTDPAVAKRGLLQVEKRDDGDCSPQPTGAGPVPSPDTPSAFKSFATLQAMATGAPTPNGYASVFTNLQSAVSASNFMGLYTLDSFDSLTCASKCDQKSGCVAFNVYIERDPSRAPNAVSCPNPASTTNYRCTLWGAPVSSGQATNTYQLLDDFYIIITGSNAYNKNSPPNTIAGYDGPVGCGGAINAPLTSTGEDTYMGNKFYAFSQSQGYTPSTCASACSAQTAYNKAHPAADGTYKTCVFFNAFVLSENSIPQGLYCSLYSGRWFGSYGTNYGQYRGSDRYTVSQSYAYGSAG